MTEAEWLAVADPDVALAALSDRYSQRKVRLFACACCRRLLHLVGWTAGDLCEVIERYADGEATADELVAAGDAARDPDWTPALALEEAASLENLREAAGNAAGNAAYAIADIATGYYRGENAPAFLAARRQEQSIQCQLLRDIFGNPFRPVTFAPAWRTATVTTLAQAIYDDRRFADLPILADALEDAGCTNADVLEHCRTPGEHVRGCWVVDLALGKA